MPQQLDLDWKGFGPFSFPVFYGQKVYNAWAADSIQLSASIVGSILLISTLTRFALFVWGYIRPSKLQVYCHSETGSWALVTGASDGIGRGFVDELLDRGFNVLLHGRNPEKLERIIRELAQKYPRRTIQYAIADSSQADHPETAVVEKVKQLPGRLTVLVNNVGGIPTSGQQFIAHGQMSTASIDAQININARFPTHLTQGLLPILQENQPSVILNCGSIGGVIGVPYIATYTASKAYIHTLTLALKGEMVAEGLAPPKNLSSGVEVQGFIIGNVRSAGNTTELPLFTIDARTCAKGCLAKIGSGNALEFANWRHAVQAYVWTWVPEKWARLAMVKEMQKRRELEAKGQ